MKSYNTTQVAKMLGTTAQKLNKKLEKLGIQTSYRYNDRVYWKLTAPYAHKGYDYYDNTYATKVDRIKLLPTLHWTEKGKEFIRKELLRLEQWQAEGQEPFTNSLHCYINTAGRRVVQLTKYDPSEPLDGSRAYISEERRKQFCKSVQNCTYQKLHKFNGRSYAVDERDVELYKKWEQYIARYHKYNVLLKEV